MYDNTFIMNWQLILPRPGGMPVSVKPVAWSRLQMQYVRLAFLFKCLKIKFYLQIRGK